MVVSIETIMKVVYNECIGQWQKSSKGRGIITFEEFRKILLANDICIDERTIRAKWNVLVAKEVFKPFGKKNNLSAVVEFDILAYEFPSLPRIYTHTTHTQKYAATEEASE